MKKILVAFGLCLVAVNAFALDDIDVQLNQTRVACSGISEMMADLKSGAGLNAVVTGAGAVAGGVALGAGLTKANTDSEIERLELSLAKLEEKQKTVVQKYDKIVLDGEDAIMRECNALVSLSKDIQSVDKEKTDMQNKINAATDKSKSLGDLRTGAMAGAALTDTVGTVLAAGNRVDGDLQLKIDSCVASVNELKNAYNVARVEGGADDVTLRKIADITHACSEWKNVDLSGINSKSTGAAVSGGTGAALALAGMFTSASANSDAVRNNNSDEGKAKEKNLNNASNVLAGGSAVASVVSTVFSATQISAIKKAVSVAEKCEEALK